MTRKPVFLAVVLFCAGCGGNEAAPQPSSMPPSTSMYAVIERPIAPTSLPPKSCTPVPSGTVQAMPAPLIPRVAREPLSAEGNTAGQELAAKIRPALEQVCASGDFSLDATRKALADHSARVFQPDASVTAVAFVITLPSACVLGEVRRGNVRISVEGTTKTARCE
jgi:hypothetical protein